MKGHSFGALVRTNPEGGSLDLGEPAAADLTGAADQFSRVRAFTGAD